MTGPGETPRETGSLPRRLVGLAAAASVAYLVLELRSLILPVIVGGLLAYICRPLVTRLERLRIPRDAAIVLLLVGVTLVAAVVVNGARDVAPSEANMLGLRVRALHKVNVYREALLGPDQARGHRLFRWVRADLDPLLDELTRTLALTPEERDQLLAQLSAGGRDPRTSRQLLAFDRANAEALEKRALVVRDGSAQPAATAPPDPSPGPGVLREVLSTWAIAPLAFYFLLRDTGEIKRGLLAMVPNRFFEPTLTVLADLDEALGSYVRGISLECGFLGATVALLMMVVGIPPRWAIAVGIVAGASNVIPYAGTALAMLSGLAYALLADDYRPLLPWVNDGNFALWVVVAMVLAEILKNVVYEPIVLGRQVKLHPLVMAVGAVGGATLYGPVGMLLAIPAITIVKAFVSSSARQLKAYGLV